MSVKTVFIIYLLIAAITFIGLTFDPVCWNPTKWYTDKFWVRVVLVNLDRCITWSELISELKGPKVLNRFFGNIAWLFVDPVCYVHAIIALIRWHLKKKEDGIL